MPTITSDKGSSHSRNASAREDNNITIDPIFPVFGFSLVIWLVSFPFPFLIAVSQYMSNLAWQNWSLLFGLFLGTRLGFGNEPDIRQNEGVKKA